MEDSVPRTVEGAVLSIADKADSIAGMFALGSDSQRLERSFCVAPTGQRHRENRSRNTSLPILLSRLFDDAREAYRGSEAEKKFSAKVEFPKGGAAFFRERLEFYLREVAGLSLRRGECGAGRGGGDVVDAVARARGGARSAFSRDFESLLIAFKRMKNILRRQADRNLQWPGSGSSADCYTKKRKRTRSKRFASQQGLVDAALRSKRDYESALARDCQASSRDRCFSTSHGDGGR